MDVKKFENCKETAVDLATKLFENGNAQIIFTKLDEECAKEARIFSQSSDFVTTGPRKHYRIMFENKKGCESHDINKDEVVAYIVHFIINMGYTVVQ